MTRQLPLTALDEVVGRLQRRHGPAAVRWGGDPASAEVWPTGIPVLDAVLPQGLSCGRISVLTGERGRATGRLTLLQALAARASRSMEVAYVDLAGTLDPGFLADLGADLEACYVVRPPRRALGPGLAMARTLVAAGVPWLAVALGSAAGRERGWEHALSALVGVVQGRGAVACVSAPSPPAAPLAYASSLTIACTPLDWQLAHGDVTGLRVRLTVVKSKIGGQGGRLSSADDGLGGVPPTGRVSAQMNGEVGLLLRYPRPHS
ncbi:MAG: recA bacterial recombination protein, partial [Actinomycetota bacterium]|nr:recA bacterial recombination protein [Actinomycetota bacterium]